MVPMTRQTDAIDPRGDTERELVVFGAPSTLSEARLYEDDGDTSDWRDGGGLEHHFSLRRDASDLELSCRTKGFYRPAFDAIVVRPISVDGVLRLVSSESAVALVRKA